MDDYKKTPLSRVVLVRVDEKTYRLIKMFKINAPHLCRDALNKFFIEKKKYLDKIKN